MKRACLLIVVPALLVALGFAQTPPASGNTDPSSIKGCLGGSDGNYTFIEDNTGHSFKITTSTVDLKPHLGHDVTLVGQKASATAASGADNSFAVTSLNMISEHCAAAAAAPAGSISTPADTTIPPPAAAAVPASTIPGPADTTSAPAAASGVAATTVTTPAAEPAATPTVATPAAAPATTVPPAAEAAGTPAVATIAHNATTPAEPAGTPIVATPAPVAIAPTPAETASVPAAASMAPDATARPETVVTPKAATAHRTRVPADHPKPSETLAAAVPPAETATPLADAAKPSATDTASSQTAGAPDADAATPGVTRGVTAKKGSPLLWISIAVVVLIMGTLVPLINRWRKRRLLAQSAEQNLSFSHRASSESGNSAKPITRKAA